MADLFHSLEQPLSHFTQFWARHELLDLSAIVGVGRLEALLPVRWRQEVGQFQGVQPVDHGSDAWVVANAVANL